MLHSMIRVCLAVANILLILVSKITRSFVWEIILKIPQSPLNEYFQLLRITPSVL